MKITTEAKLDRNTLLSLHKVPAETIAAFFQKAHMETRDIEVVSIMYYPVTKNFFAKLKCAGRTFFSLFEFDEKKRKFISLDEHRYTAAEAKAKFNEIANMTGNKASTNMKLWCVWGSN